MKRSCFRVGVIFFLILVLVITLLSHFPAEDGKKKPEHKKPEHKAKEEYLLFKGPNPHNFETLISSTRCENLVNKKNPAILIVIFTTQSTAGFEKRQAIRSTWAQDCTNTFYGRCTYLFVFGRQPDELSDLLLGIEHERYGDIIQENFVDSYKNLTYKSIFTWKWISTHCKGKADYIVKTDDDVFVRIDNMLKSVEKLKRKPGRSMHGFVIRGTPHRHKESKYFVTKEEYPYSRYPPLCSGTGVIYPSSIASELYNISLSTPYVHLEDVYTSLCASKLGISPVCEKVNGMFISNIRYSACKYRNAITVHELQPEEMIQVHKSIKAIDPTKPCTRANRARLGPRV